MSGARERILSAALESLATAVVLVDSQQRVRYCNPAASALVGAPLADVSGRPFMRAFRIRPRTIEVDGDRAISPADLPEDVYYELSAAEGWVPVRYHRRQFVDGFDLVEMQDVRDEHERELRLRQSVARAAAS